MTDCENPNCSAHGELVRLRAEVADLQRYIEELEADLRSYEALERPYPTDQGDTL
jgi:hypothetical protein